MKVKKFIVTAASAALAISLAAGIAGGCAKKHTHSVKEWETLPGMEVSCVSGGQLAGICTDCGERVIKDVTPDPSDLALHDYGEWEVTKTPTRTEEGKAVKTCKHSCTVNHTKEQVLPKLEEIESYASITMVSPPRPNKAGVRKYVYETNLGDVTFNADIDTDAADTMLNTIIKGATHENLVKKSEGKVKDIQGERSFTYFFGSDYTHLQDPSDNRKDEWYSLDGNGNLFAIRRSNEWFASGDSGEWLETIKAYADATIENMYGYDHSFMLSERRYYGAGGVLFGVFCDLAREGEALNYSEHLSTGGLDENKFSFDLENNDYYGSFECKFTLTAEGMINYLRIDEKVFNYGENGMPAATAQYTEFIEFNQYKTGTDTTTDKNGKTIEVTQNMYPSDSFYITDMSLSYTKGNSLTVKPLGADPVEANEGEEVKVSFSNILPDNGLASLKLDPVNVWLKPDGKDEVPLSADYDPDYKVYGTYDINEEQVLINCQKEGSYTFILKTSGGKCIKTVKLNVKPLPPAANTLRIICHEYYDADGSEGYSPTNQTNRTVTVYNGQPCAVRLASEINVESYKSLSFSLKAVKDADGNEIDSSLYTVLSVAAGSEQSQLYNGEAVLVFTFKQAGSYKVTLQNTEFNDNVTRERTVTIKSENPPSYSSLLAGGAEGVTYSRNSEDFNDKLSVTFKEGIATVKVGALTTVYDYTLGADGTITATYKSGATATADDKKLDFSFRINEAYKIVVTYPIGQRFSGGVEITDYASLVLEKEAS